MNKNYWFKRKRYGYGFVPVTLKGWALTLGLIFSIFITSYIFSKDVPEDTPNNVSLWYYLTLIIIIVIFVAIIYRFSPKPKWRFGKKESDNLEEDF